MLNDELMKNRRTFGRDYFDELLERIREIGASERRAYQKITEVFEQCSYYYDKTARPPNCPPGKGRQTGKS